MLRNSYDEALYRPFDPILRQDNNKWIPRHSLWLALSLDQRDIFFDPSSGYFLFQRVGMHGLLNNEREHYLRSDSKVQYFHTLFDIPITENWNLKSVLAVNAGLSLILRQPGRNEHSHPHMPAIEEANKLAIDGMFVGRGWSSEFRNKGLLLLDSWIELRFPLVHGLLAFDLFFDSAAVESKQGFYFRTNDEGDPNFTIENFRFSYGGGLRFTMPQFPLRLSLVKRFTINDGAIEWRPGAIFGNPDNPAAGMDLVLSFVLSY
jgi:outer membrane protein insertion porin family